MGTDVEVAEILMMDIEKHARSMQDLIDGEVRVHELMRNHTTFRIGGPADIFALPDSVKDVKRIINYARANKVPCCVIGNGSNLLVSNNGVRGIVVRIGKRMGDVEFDGESVKTQAGGLLSNLSRMAAEQKLSGLEFGAGIPGTLGGAVVMNAGSGEQNISQILASVKVMDAEGNIIEIGKEDCDFQYRGSRFKHSGEVVLEAMLRLQHDEQTAIMDKMKELLGKRKKTMPLNYPSAGSIFRNPEGDFAGRLIEQAGCKGMRKGDAQVSDLHANWIVNLGHAEASNVLELISHIRDEVRRKSGIQLELEVSVLS